MTGVEEHGQRIGRSAPSGRTFTPVFSPQTGNPLLCCYGDCRRPADADFSTAPVFDTEGHAYVFVHCSIGHMMATMQERPEFGDLPLRWD